MQHLPIPTNHAYTVPLVRFYGCRYSADSCLHDTTLSKQSWTRPKKKISTLCGGCRAGVATLNPVQKWFSYPYRCKWIGRGNQLERQHDAPSLEAVLQAWLYEGVLCTFTDGAHTLSTLDLIKQTAGLTTIDTTHLEANLREWLFARLDEWSKAERSAWEMRARDLLEEVYRAYALVMRSTADKGSPYYALIPPELTLSILVMWETLELVLDSLDPKSVGLHKTLNGPCEFLKVKLGQHFWCPRDIARYESQIALHYISQLGPRRDRKDHTLCSSQRCECLELDDHTYRSKHVMPGCKCPLVGFDTDTLADMWRESQIPVVRFNETTNTLRLEGIDISRQSTFMAVSHVASQGLGNPINNSLPLCQVRHTHKAVQIAKGRLPGAQPAIMPWFLDTLCVPAKEASDAHGHATSSARKTAVSIMGVTFSNAAAVLVRDAEIEDSTLNDDACTILHKVMLSHWSFRVWTFLEASKAKSLIFLTGRGPRDISQLIPWGLLSATTHRHDSLQDMLIADVTARVSNYAGESQLQLARLTDRPMAVVSACMDVASRSIAVPEDLLVCVAIIAGLNPKEVRSLMGTSLPAQAVRFLRLAEKVDPLLAIEAAARLKIPFFAWAPQHLVTALANPSSRDWSVVRPNLLTVSGQGLSGHWHSVCFQLSPLPTLGLRKHPQAVVLDCSPLAVFVTEFCKLVLDLPSGQETSPDVPDHAFRFFEAHAGKNLALLYLNPPDCEFVPTECKGILVEILRSSGDTQRVRRICGTMLRGYVYTHDRLRSEDGNLIIRGSFQEKGAVTWCIQ